MEYRDDGLMVDFSGQGYQQTNERPPANARSVVIDTKQEKEAQSMDQETRLVRAMGELRATTPSKDLWRRMPESQRDAFRIYREGVFKKYGLTPGQFGL